MNASTTRPRTTARKLSLAAAAALVTLVLTGCHGLYVASSDVHIGYGHGYVGAPGFGHGFRHRGPHHRSGHHRRRHHHHHGGHRRRHH